MSDSVGRGVPAIAVKEQAESVRVSSRIVSVALGEAPSVASELRARLYPSDGRTERGVAVAHERTPLLTGVADDGHEFFTVLVEWCEHWAHVLGIQGPAATVPANRNLQDAHSSAHLRDAPVLGFAAHTTPAAAAEVVGILSRWLLSHLDRISALKGFEVFASDVSDRVRGLRWSLGLHVSRRVVQRAAPRPCPVCGEVEVEVEFFGQSLLAAELRGEDLVANAGAIEIRCGYCGHVIPASLRKLARWLS